jgi:hypothetical protein
MGAVVARVEVHHGLAHVQALRLGRAAQRLCKGGKDSSGGAGQVQPLPTQQGCRL